MPQKGVGKGGRPLTFFFSQFLVTDNLVGRRFAHPRFADSRESIRANRFTKKGHLARFVRIASSLRFAFKFA